jgi:hypothetical protein
MDQGLAQSYRGGWGPLPEKDPEAPDPVPLGFITSWGPALRDRI